MQKLKILSLCCSIFLIHPIVSTTGRYYIIEIDPDESQTESPMTQDGLAIRLSKSAQTTAYTQMYGFSQTMTQSYTLFFDLDLGDADTLDYIEFLQWDGDNEDFELTKVRVIDYFDNGIMTGWTGEKIDEGDPGCQRFRANLQTGNWDSGKIQDGCPTVTGVPTCSPVGGTSDPSGQPTSAPTQQPSNHPTANPSTQPTQNPSSHPTQDPTSQPSAQPSVNPSMHPSLNPSVHPSVSPSVDPSVTPSVTPSVSPSVSPSEDPSQSPSYGPSIHPTKNPSTFPSEMPSMHPSRFPSQVPTIDPSISPSLKPSQYPSNFPTSIPTSFPPENPSYTPTNVPALGPSLNPTSVPTLIPSLNPTSHPTSTPTATNFDEIMFFTLSHNISRNFSFNSSGQVVVDYTVDIVCDISNFTYENETILLHSLYSVSSNNSLVLLNRTHNVTTKDDTWDLLLFNDTGIECVESKSFTLTVSLPDDLPSSSQWYTLCILWWIELMSPGIPPGNMSLEWFIRDISANLIPFSSVSTSLPGTTSPNDTSMNSNNDTTTTEPGIPKSTESKKNGGNGNGIPTLVIIIVFAVACICCCFGCIAICLLGFVLGSMRSQNRAVMRLLRGRNYNQNRNAARDSQRRIRHHNNPSERQAIEPVPRNIRNTSPVNSSNLLNSDERGEMPPANLNVARVISLSQTVEGDLSDIPNDEDNFEISSSRGSLGDALYEPAPVEGTTREKTVLKTRVGARGVELQRPTKRRDVVVSARVGTKQLAVTTRRHTGSNANNPRSLVSNEPVTLTRGDRRDST